MSTETRPAHEAGADPGASPPAGTQALDLQPQPVDPHSPQLTVRALLTGMVLGAVLSVCNIHAGLKLGMVFNMSIVGALLSYGFWTGIHRASARRVRAWGLLENNINQTACSAAASVASAGLIAPIPAWTLVTGQRLSWPWLALWVFSVCLVGISVAVGLRRQMIVADRLPFPTGIATAETLHELHARGRRALTSVLTLVVAAVLAAGVELYRYVQTLGVFALPASIQGHSLRALGFAIAPSPVMCAVGGLIGLRASVSLLVGAIVAFGLVVPRLVHDGTILQPGFVFAVKWLIWPGVTLMVVSALTSFAFSWRSLAAALRGLATRNGAPIEADPKAISRGAFLITLAISVALSVGLQVLLFKIVWWAAALGVLLSFGLALVAVRVAGETGINPIAAVGKVTQVALAALLPHSPATNLMASNVTAGAASQCAELLEDLKCGHLLGASARRQTVAQVCGAAAGALAGSLAYLLLIRDPARQLLTEDLPAPGVAGMKAVADLFAKGESALPAGAPGAMLVAAVAALLLTLLEKLAPPALRRWMPSGASVGLAFVFPAHVSLTIFIGGLAAFGLRKLWAHWSGRHLVTVCAGAVAGDTLTGVGTGLHRLLGG